jgi:hypothetical protein
MDNFWMNFALELSLFSLLGVLYYFYQKRKIVQYEANKTPLVMNYILQACLTERGDHSHSKLDHLIEALDDYLQDKLKSPPLILLQHFSQSADCSSELKSVIEEGLKEIEE